MAAFSSDVSALLQDMIDTMLASGASGLAAIQIGVPKRAIVLNGLGGRAIALVNPRILKSSGFVTSTESCLSIPGRRVRLERYASVTVEHLRQHGLETFEAREPDLAVALQHEIDHLNGVLIVDRAHQKTPPAVLLN